MDLTNSMTSQLQDTIIVTLTSTWISPICHSAVCWKILSENLVLLLQTIQCVSKSYPISHTTPQGM